MKEKTKVETMIREFYGEDANQEREIHIMVGKQGAIEYYMALYNIVDGSDPVGHRKHLEETLEDGAYRF